MQYLPNGKGNYQGQKCYLEDSKAIQENLKTIMKYFEF